MRVQSILILWGAVSILCSSGCSKSETHKRPAAKDEIGQPVKRLRDDTESELQDLRGRWLATEALLIRLRDQLKQLDNRLTKKTGEHTQQITALEITLKTVTAELHELKHGASLPEAEQLNRERITRCFEEVFCLKKRSEDADIEGILRRYGFKDAENWESAWNNPEIDEAFKQKVEARAKLLCP
ncbi:MAG TPA: hypothetical protein EYN06_09520 [Myxococcales bacterium]|nr:hypothetical protein [Myxococcales bacterium]HIN86708.1 hypothetical protein [Myxococcales bacterium]